MLKTAVIGKTANGTTQVSRLMVMSGDQIVLVDATTGQPPKKVTTKMVNKDLHIFAEGATEPSVILNDYASFSQSVDILGIDPSGAYVNYGAAASGSMELGAMSAPVAAASAPVMSTSAWWGVGILAVAGGVAAAAGGGGGGSSTPVAPAVTLSGILVDSIVQGVAYTTTSDATVKYTGANGSFTYKAGDIVVFKVGNATIGTFNTANMPADGIVMPQDIVGVPRTDTTNPAVVNIAQFLQSLDSDRDPSNGIIITDSSITTIISVQTATDAALLAAVQEASGTTLVTASDAQAHLSETTAVLTTPTATISLSDTTLNTGDTATVTITFSEAVIGFSNSDVTVQSGTLDTFVTTNGGITWTATLTPAVNTVNTVNTILLANTYTDITGNSGASAVSVNYTVDTTIVAAPQSLTVTITDDEPMATANMDGSNTDGSTDANGADILYTFTFSAAVQNFTIEDVVITMERTDGSVVTAYTSQTVMAELIFKTFEKVSDTVYTLSVTPEAGYEGVMRVSVATSNAVNISGNTIDASNLSTLSSLQAVDMRAPFPLDPTHSSILITPITADPLYHRIVLSFDENLEQVNQSAPSNFGVVINGDTFDVNSIGVSDNDAGMADNQVFLYLENVVNARGEIFDWSTAGITVSYTDQGNDLASPTNPIIHDLAGNDATSFNDYIADTLAPDALITIDDTILSSGNVAIMTVAFSEAVLSLDIGDFSVQNGFLENLATVNGGKTWTADLKADAGIDDAINIITLGTSYTDAHGITGLGTTSSNYEVDTLAPALTGSTKSVPPRTATFTFDEALDDVAFPDAAMFTITDTTLTPDTTDGNTLQTFKVIGIKVVGSTATISIDGSISDTTAWTITYSNPSGNDANALQDIYGTDVITFTAVI